MLLSFPAMSVTSQSWNERHEQVLQALAQGDYALVEKSLLELRDLSPRAFAINNYDYLLGRTEQQLGKSAEAAQEFLMLVDRGSLLSEYAYWHLAEIARSAGNLKSERQYLAKVLGQYPDSLLQRKAKWRLAESYAESEEFQRAMAIYRELVKEPGRRGREAQLNIGLIEFQIGKAFDARETLNKLVSSGARDDTVLEAVRRLDEIDETTGSASDLTDHLRRARVYQANRAFDHARRHYRWMIDHFPGHQEIPEALFEIGRGYYQQRAYQPAITWFGRAHDHYPKSKEGEQGYYQVGHAHARAEQWLQAVERYERFITAYPKSEWLPGAHLNAIDALRSAGRDDEALGWCRRTMERFPGELAATTALFSQARIHLSQDQYQAALDDFTKLLEHNLERTGPSAPNRPEVMFMRGYCLERLQKWAEAIDAHLSLPEELDAYYGYRATARLRALLSGPQAKSLVQRKFKELHKQTQTLISTGEPALAARAGRQAWRLTDDADAQASLLAQIKRTYLRLPSYRPWSQLRFQDMGREVLTGKRITPRARTHRALARELIFLGLCDEGAPELGAAIESSGRRRPTPNELYTVASYFNRGGHPNEAIRIAEDYFAPVIPKDYGIELLPKELARLLFPTPYSALLDKEAGERNVDPRFVLSLMRQESRFQAGAKSPAAARGLMQFIPDTAQEIAAKLGLAAFKLDDLYRPEVSIQFAAAHLADLFQQYPDNPHAVAAAYNAGSDNVRRWLNRARVNEADRFVIEIGFRETKDYVYRVMVNYWVYQQLIPGPRPK
jgi:soluble lytic murein transglycosylase